ncbi:hypothetical protein [Paracoccus alkanivorans]|nr:hypothetical protein [Paracoccus alkanivorans]
MNPTEGLDVEQADYIDGEYSPGEDEGQGDDDQSQDEGNPPETENKPEPKPVKKAEQAPDHTDKTPQEERPQRQTKVNKTEGEGQKSMFGGFSASEMIQKISGLILNDLQDGAPLDETLEMFEVQLAEIQKAEPDEYEAMMDEFKAFVAQRDGEGE